MSSKTYKTAYFSTAGPAAKVHMEDNGAFGLVVRIDTINNGFTVKAGSLSHYCADMHEVQEIVRSCLDGYTKWVMKNRDYKE
jgi:hypothetical protein